MTTCNRGRCACGRPIVFRMIRGRRTPIHCRQGRPPAPKVRRRLSR